MGALDGLKILDFSSLLPGPYATLVMADMGAEVLRVSSKSKLDLSLAKPPRIEGSAMNATAATLCRNKKSISLNMKMPESVEIVKKLVSEYDIVIDQFRPGVMDKLGIGYEALKAVNPRVIYCSLTGYGQSGPLKMRAGHDINYLALSGVMSYAGRKGQVPSLYGIQIADLAGGSMNVIVGVLAAVISRNNTGKGQYVDVSMMDAAMALTVGISANAILAGQLPYPGSERTSGHDVYDFYETKDGRYLSVGCMEQKFFEQFCNAVGMPELIPGGSSPKEPGPVKEKVAAVLKTRTRDEWAAIFAGMDACVEPVLGYDEVISSEETAARQMIIEVPMPDNDRVKVKQLATPIKFSDTPNEYRVAGCPVGWNQEEVLTKLGYTEDVIVAMAGKGVFD